MYYQLYLKRVTQNSKLTNLRPSYKKLTIAIKNIHRIIRKITIKNTKVKSTIKSCE